MFYESLSELPKDERPSQKIIDDDYAFDAWLKEREAKDSLKSTGATTATGATQGTGNWGKASKTIGG